MAGAFADPRSRGKRGRCAMMGQSSGGSDMAKQSTLTGAAAVCFALGLIALFMALYRDASHGGALLWVGLTLLVATGALWFASAKAGAAS
jgi:hypothetical protein